MGLHFVNPLFLWGTLLASVPIIIHLINRKRARRVEFAAIAFVLRSRQRNARKLRLKRLVLLAMRTLLCLAIPLALARPFIAPHASQLASSSHGPTAVVIVLDTSMSMQYQLGRKTLFERAQAIAIDVLDALHPEDAVAVLPCADREEDAIPTANYDLAEARGVVFEATVGFRRSDLTNCLALSARILSGSPLAGKRVVIITDLTTNAWRLDVPAPVVNTEAGEFRPQIVVLDAADGAELPNRWIDDVQIEPAFALGARGYAFAFNVRGSGGAAGPNLSASLEADEKILSRGFVDLPRNGTVRKTLSHQFSDGGEVFGRLSIESDALRADDERSFITFVQRDMRALVVDGDPAVNRYNDEAFFVERALSPGRGSGSSIRPTIVDADGFIVTDLARFDLVLLLNVREVPMAKAAELDAFVRGGGGLFISVGEHIDVDAYNTTLGGLLPARLHVERAADGGAVAFASIAWDHPVFSVFVGDGREGFASARFFHYLLTRPPHRDTQVLATYEDGAPALLVRDHGRGRVGLYTSTVDHDWTDFAIRTAFLPVMQQISGYLARALDERREGPIPIGATRRLAVPEGATELLVVAPSGRTTRYDEAQLARGELDYSETDTPGLYRAFVRTGGDGRTPAEGLSFTVVTDPRESDTTRIEPEELMARLGGEIEGHSPVVTTAGIGDSEATRRPLWTWLLLLAGLAMVVEGWLLR